jgi:putative ABC transport system permease protein
MGRFAWSQVRFRPARALALILGVLVAATAFTVLTAASRTLQARTTGTVAANFQPAYDILVRPKGARSAVESETGTVQPDFLSGIYGGITTNQWQQIERIPGVSVAAPIAMVGYADLSAAMYVPIPAAALKGSGRQLYRISTTWVSDNGASRVTQPPGYLYVTPKALITGPVNGATPTDVKNAGCELTRDSVLPRGTNPFGLAAQSYTLCWSRVNGYDISAPHSAAGYYITWTVPVLVAAIDPDAEAKLDGLNKALVSGGYLAENDGQSSVTLPVLASSASGMNEYAQTTLQELAEPATTPDMDLSWAKAEESAPGRTVTIVRSTAQQAYHDMLTSGPTVRGSVLGNGFSGTPVDGYWSIGPVAYQRTKSGALTPRQVINPSSVWFTDSAGSVPMDDEDSQYRTVTSHVKVPTTQPSDGADFAIINVAGVFDPSKIKSFDPLSQVPLGDYKSVDAMPASASSRQALHGSDLLPNQNLGGLVSQPVNLVTTLSALPALENTLYYGDVNTSDPISVVRVRVAGVSGAGALSRARINAVALQIAQRTGLEVDVVAGSSPSPVTIDLPADKFGQPGLTLTENWVKEGVALAILDAVDRQSVVLFILILVVCVLFVANAATAAVRGRRRELGVLAAVGWRRSRLFATALGELTWIGLAAGLLAAALAIPVSVALGLDASPGRALLAVPVAMGVAIIAGLVPAWLAARADPVTSVRPPVLAVRRAHQPRGITSLAVLNVLRTPGRTLTGVVSLAIGIAALTLLTAVTVAFRGQITGTLLGNAIDVQVRGVDYVAAGATVALGVLAVADVVFLNITERSAELATISAFGWRDALLGRLVITEGALIGITGSLIGAGLGLGAAAWLAGQLPARLVAIAVATVAAGVIITATAALLPAALLRRLPTASLLAEE